MSWLMDAINDQLGNTIKRRHSRLPDDLDRHIALRVNEERKARGISQLDLADRIGCTYQQVQKYERAINRVPAARLHRIAEAFVMNVAGFFPEGQAAPTGPAFGVPTCHSFEVTAPSNLMLLVPLGIWWRHWLLSRAGTSFD